MLPTAAPGDATNLVLHGTGTPLRFDWHPPCRVPVVERIDKQGQRAVFAYDIVVTPVGSTDLLEVRMERLQPVEVNGQDASGPGMQAQLRPMLAVSSALPVLRVARDGAFVDLIGEQVLVERMLDLSGVTRGTLDETQLRRMLTSPQMLATLRERAGDYWRVWVGAWVGLDLAPGEMLDGVEELPVGDGVLRAPVRYRNDGPVPGNPRLLRVARVSTLAGPEVEAFLARVLMGVGTATGKPVTADSVRSARRTTTIVAETDPATLRPLRTEYTTETELEVRDQPMQTQKQVQETTFDWNRAVGCGR